jgi:mannose-1-phosphate guanylyltransferase
VVDTEDALLVMPRERAQDVRKIIDALKAQNRTRYL